MVVASHGNDEEPVLEAALRAEVPYVGLVASRRRGPAVLASLEVDERLRSRVRTPAGLDIGARTPPEVALSILAEIVAVLREPRLRIAMDDHRTRTRRDRTGARSGVRHDGRPGRRVAPRRDAHRRGVLLRHRLSKRLPRQPSGVRAVTRRQHERRGTPAGSRHPAKRARQCRLPRRRRHGHGAVLRVETAASQFSSRASQESARPRPPRRLRAALDTPLVRLQCYEGIDVAEALYEWNYPRQLLAIRLAEARGIELAEDALFSDGFLIARPLLAALRHPGPRPAVLLIDEVDRADDDFEAFLLELLGEGAVTIPELGTVRATHRPIVVLTSNRTRELHDALKRRCLYHWIDYPPAARAAEIVRRRVPGSSRLLAEQAARVVERLRGLDLQKRPGIAETIDWVAALELLGVRTVDTTTVDRTLGSVLKYVEDQQLARASGLSVAAP